MTGESGVPHTDAGQAQAHAVLVLMPFVITFALFPSPVAEGLRTMKPRARVITADVAAIVVVLDVNTRNMRLSCTPH